LQNFARFLAAGNVAAEFTGDAHQLLDLLHGAHLGRARLVPEVVLDAAAYVQAHGDAHQLIGSTLRMLLSTVSIEPSGMARRKLDKL
jgi:hypothetical protein